MILPRLRANLDFMPSPAKDRPGLLVRDSFQYSERVLIVPPVLIHGLEFFDGERTELELSAHLGRKDAAEHLIEALSKAGFLEDETYFQLREKKRGEFARCAVREPAHSGSAYPDRPGALRKVMQRYLDGGSPATEPVLGIAAPHVSPEGGWQSYRAAYSALTPDLRERTFVVLGTSHYGQPDKFGLTRKPFATPYGATVPAGALLEELALQPGALMEDYCHAVEHSIEFQVLFLQAIYGPAIKVLPILCGSFARSIYQGGLPEDNDEVKGFLGALGDIAAREADRLCWILGIDMAHMGARYGDQFSAHADRDEMAAVAERDAARIERIAAGDVQGFWDLVQADQDDLKWCGSSPLYTFLRALPQARGALRRYEQWNIDERSVVSFAGISFQ